MKKKCKVVRINYPVATKGHLVGSMNGKFERFHLYLISDDEIKEGDWCLTTKEAYPTGLPQLSRCHKKHDNEIELESGWKKQISYPQSGQQVFKVIASTDPELCWAKYDDCDGTEEVPNKRALLPQIPIQFNKEYLKSKGCIDEVMVEYVNSRTGKSDPLEWDENGLCDEWKLKLIDNNEVIIEYPFKANGILDLMQKPYDGPFFNLDLEPNNENVSSKVVLTEHEDNIYLKMYDCDESVMFKFPKGILGIKKLERLKLALEQLEGKL